MERRPLHSLNGRQVNVLLEVLLAGAFVTGVTSWAVGTGWNRWWTAAHAVCGLAVLVLAPVKVRRSVVPGMRRGRWTRWLSVAFGAGVFVVALLGVLHSTGLWHGVGSWSALWSHVLVAFAVVPLFVWHVVSRWRVRARRVDLDRRLLLGTGAAVGIAAVVTGSIEVATRVAGLGGGGRRFTGSHEIGSYDPDAMPTVSWIDDRAPATSPADWRLTVAGRPVRIDDLVAMAVPLTARLDCTGGWWSEQSWDVVPVADLLRAGGDGARGVGARSFKVTSATGYARLFPMADAATTYLAVGYGRRPLRRGHGAPVRLVAPSRRGPWWVKWVVAVTPDDRPWWLQLPFPPT